MITIFIKDDDDDDDDDDYDDDYDDDADDDDRYGDFSCFLCVYIGVYLTHIQNCVNIPSIHS